MKEYLSIEELAEPLELSIQTLYYYDSVDIFSPRECDEKNGCGKYEFSQIYELAAAFYMRRLGYPLEEIEESRTSLNSGRAVDIMKQRSQKLYRQWQRLLNIDGATQKKIRFMEREMNGVRLDEIAVKHLEGRKFISIGGEGLLYGENFLYPCPTIAFYERDRKYFRTYLYPDHEEVPKAIPQSKIQTIRRGGFLYGYHLGEYEGVSDTIRHLREARPGPGLGTQAINFNILDQFVESGSKSFITAMQIRVLQIHMTDDGVSNEET